MKRKLAIAAALLSLLALSVAGSLAYFTGSGEAHNFLETGAISIEVKEFTLIDDVETPYPSDPINGLMAGDEVSKIVKVANTGSGSAYVRVAVTTEVTKDEEPIERLINDISFDINTTDWFLDTDGYYYCKEPLAPGELSPALFNNVFFSQDMAEEYENCQVTVDIQADAVQSANNPIPGGGDASDVAGW